MLVKRDMIVDGIKMKVVLDESTGFGLGLTKGISSAGHIHLLHQMRFNLGWGILTQIPRKDIHNLRAILSINLEDIK